MLENGDRIIETLEVDEISVIKIHVEGAEGKVIEGLKNTISNKRPFLIFEMLPFSERNPQKEDFFNECKSLIQLIRSKDMTIFSILHNNVDSSNEMILFSDKDLTIENDVLDYVAVPNELLSEFKKILKVEK